MFFLPSGLRFFLLGRFVDFFRIVSEILNVLLELGIWCPIFFYSQFYYFDGFISHIIININNCKRNKTLYEY
jgi:hypothetical protein